MHATTAVVLPTSYTPVKKLKELPTYMLQVPTRYARMLAATCDCGPTHVCSLGHRRVVSRSLCDYGKVLGFRARAVQCAAEGAAATCHLI